MIEWLKLVWEEITLIGSGDMRCKKCRWKIRSPYPGQLCVGCYDRERR